ncbi:MAG: KH domain-containing protein [Epsilonproteobacteria bacterium]|nr:KH domain-containing protein [Campylobacterota bacterium]
MVKDFIESYTKLLAANPESVRVETLNSADECDELVIYVNQSDVGKIIGKDGKMINAIKAVVSGCKAKGEKNYRISVQADV